MTSKKLRLARILLILKESFNQNIYPKIDVIKLKTEKGNCIINSIENKIVTIALSLIFGILKKGAEGILHIIKTNREQGMKNIKEK